MKHYIESNFLNKENYIKLFNNYIFFGLQVFLGFIIAAIIVIKLGIVELGIFTQTYAILVIFSQISVFGLNDSILKRLSTLEDSNLEGKLILNVIVASLINAMIFSTILFLFNKTIFSVFQSDLLTDSNKYLFLAIFFLTINKVLFSIIQAKRYFNFFAILNFFRPLFIVLLLFVAIFFSEKNNYSLIFFFAEIILFLIIIVFFNLKKYIKNENLDLNYIKQHYLFASKVFFNGFLSESFIRIDIIMIGILLEDKFVGIYSLAALFFEGIYQFSIVLRNVINPELGKLYFEKKYNKLIYLIRYASLLSFSLIIVLSVVSYYIFPYLWFFVDSNTALLSHELLKFLLIGLIFYSLIVPSEHLLFQSNNPLGQSVYMMTLSINNIIINYILISKFGVIGAAIGTAIVYFSTIIIFNFFIIFLTDLKRGIYFYLNDIGVKTNFE